MRKFIWNNINLSTQCFNCLINNCTQLEELTLQSADICHDGLIVTKESNKLKYLKSLIIDIDKNITNESFINIIQGCHNLETIITYGSHKLLTDASLICIAANCPNLKELKLFESSPLLE